MSVNFSTTVFLNNILVNNFGESTFDFDTNFFQRTTPDPSDNCSPLFDTSTTTTTATVSAPINIPSPSSCSNTYDHLQPSSYVPINSSNNSHFLYSPISTSDDSLCFSPAADSDFLSAASPASSLGSYMAAETFLTSSSSTNNNVDFFNHDFCLNDSLGSQNMASSSPFTIPALQVQPEENCLPTPVAAVAALSPALQQASVAFQQQQQQQQQQQDYSLMLSPSMNPIIMEQQQQQQQLPRRSTTTTRRRAPKIHRCPHCTHTSNRANNMKEHILTHDPHRPKKFACPECGKRFARKHDMKRHSKSPH